MIMHVHWQALTLVPSARSAGSEGVQQAGVSSFLNRFLERRKKQGLKKGRRAPIALDRPRVSEGHIFVHNAAASHAA